MLKVINLVLCHFPQWAFVVGIEGVDKSTWEFDIKWAVPHVLDGMMVAGRNAKSLAELLDTDEARQGDEGEQLARRRASRSGGAAPLHWYALCWLVHLFGTRVLARSAFSLCMLWFRSCAQDINPSAQIVSGDNGSQISVMR